MLGAAEAPKLGVFANRNRFYGRATSERPRGERVVLGAANSLEVAPQVLGRGAKGSER
jgi:hypothetical protein